MVETGSATPAAASDRTPPVRVTGLQTAIKIGFGIAVVAFGVAFVASRWSKISAALADSKPGWIVAAAAFAIVGQWAAALGFRAVLAAASRWLPLADVARVFFVSQLGKYIPGSIWPIVALTEMTKRYGVSRSAAGIAGVLSLLFSIVTGGVVGILLVLAGTAGGAQGLWWLVLLLPVAFAMVHPRVVVPVVDRLLRLARRAPLTLDLTGRALRGSLGWPLVSWSLLGLQCWALVVALGGPALSSLAPAIGGFALAYVAGTLFIPAPAGAGVREAVLGVALVNVIEGNAFGHDQVIVVVLLSRVLLAVADFAQAGVAVLVMRGRSARVVK